MNRAKGWQFSLESMMPVSKKLVSPAIEKFAHGVSMEKSYDLHSNKPFAKITKDQVNSLLKLQASRLDKIYSFGIKDTCYKVELVSMWYNNLKVPCWGFNVRHKAWIDHLAELEALRPGGAANWGNVVSTFLPDDGGMPVPIEEQEPDTLDEQQDDPHKNSPHKPLPAEAKESGTPGEQPEEKEEAPPREGIMLLMRKLMELSTIINNTGGGPLGMPVEPAQQPKPMKERDVLGLMEELEVDDVSDE